MWKRFVSSYFNRDMNQKLQCLTQGSKSVDEYHKEMEIIMIPARVEERPKATMNRFLNDLNKKIANILKLQHDIDLEEMVHIAAKIEKQLKSKRISRGVTSSTTQFNSRWLRRDESKKVKEKKNKQPSTNP